MHCVNECVEMKAPNDGRPIRSGGAAEGTYGYPNLSLLTPVVSPHGETRSIYSPSKLHGQYTRERARRTILRIYTIVKAVYE